jgi:hypothetical protein
VRGADAGFADLFRVAATEIGALETALETRRFAPEELAPSRDLPDVPLHQRGFGVRDERND